MTYSPGPSFSIGIEEEHQFIDPESRELLGFAAQSMGREQMLIRELMERLTPLVERLNSHEEIEHIHTILARGACTDRRLRVYAAHDGDARAAVQHLIAETKEGL